MQSPVTIIGCGPGPQSFLTEEAVRAASSAELLLGSSRLLALFPKSRATKTALGADASAYLREIEAAPDLQKAVLVTGDPGVFSLAEAIIARLGIEKCRVIPGVSAVQLAFARVGLPWADARIVSAHHELPNRDHLLSQAPDKLAVLMGHPESFGWVRTLVHELCGAHRIVVCENLGWNDERVTEVPEEALVSHRFSFRSIVLIVRQRRCS